MQKTPTGYEAQYKPEEPGPNAVKVEFAEKEVSKTPFIVNVEAQVDESKVEVQGLESRKFIDRNVIILAYSANVLMKQFVDNKHGG